MIGSEELSYFPKGRPRRLFERVGTTGLIYVSNEFGIKPTDDRLKAVRKDTSILSTFALLNVPLAVQIVNSLELFLLTTNINWTIETKAVVNLFERNPDMKKWVEREIQTSDLAIQAMNIKK